MVIRGGGMLWLCGDGGDPTWHNQVHSSCLKPLSVYCVIVCMGVLVAGIYVCVS